MGGNISLVKLYIKREEKRPVEDPARADWGLEMLDTIVPSLQGLGRQVLPTLPLLSQEGKLREVGALRLNLQLLGSQAEDLSSSLEWPRRLGNHPNYSRLMLGAQRQFLY